MPPELFALWPASFFFTIGGGACSTTFTVSGIGVSWSCPSEVSGGTPPPIVPMRVSSDPTTWLIVSLRVATRVSPALVGESDSLPLVWMDCDAVVFAFVSAVDKSFSRGISSNLERMSSRRSFSRRWRIPPVLFFFISYSTRRLLCSSCRSRRSSNSSIRSNSFC